MSFRFFKRKTGKFVVFSGKSGRMRPGGGRKRREAKQMKTCGNIVEGLPCRSGICVSVHSTGKYMDCVAEFVLRRKTRPGMPFFE
jgi:hypothetical protein